MQLLTYGFCFSVPLIIYFAANLSYSGVMFPVSGALKSSFPVPHTENFKNAWQVFAHPFSSDLYMSKMYRTTQLLIPMFVAGGYILLFLKKSSKAAYIPNHFLGSEPLKQFMLLTGLGVLMLNSYNLFFVRTFGMGHWYFPVSILWVSLLVLIRENNTIFNQKEIAHSLVMAGIVIMVFYFAHRRLDYHRIYADFYFQVAPILRDYFGEQKPKIIEADDGIITFATRFPAISSLGLMLDPKAVKAFKNKRLFRLAQQRGFDHAASLVYYIPNKLEPTLEKNMNPEQMQRRIEAFNQNHPSCDYSKVPIPGLQNIMFVKCIAKS